MSVGFEFLARDPELSRLRMLVEYLREVSEEFVFVLDDRTVAKTVKEIENWPGAVVLPYEWKNDFSDARNAGLHLIHSDWTAYFDPDELPNKRLLQFIKDKSGVAKGNPIGYLFDTHNFFGGRNQKTHLESDWHLRMWQTGKGKFYKPVHEQVMLNGRKESSTRGSALVQKAPADAFIIHAKPQALIDSSVRLYTEIEKSKNK